jgi:chaperone BCS1
MWQFLVDQLAANQFLSGGALLALAGIGFAYLRSVPRHIYNWTKRRLITEIDVPDRDASFKWLNIWLAQHPYHRRCRLWTVHTKRAREYDIDATDKNSKNPKIILSPAPGVHFLFYKKRLMILNRVRKDGAEKSGSASIPGFRESFEFTLFSRHKQVVLDLLEEARQSAHPLTDERITVLRPDYSEWVEAGKRLPRPLASVILEDGLQDSILADIKQFQESETWYNERGIPYHRGYLLYGQPGNGKSSLVTALASSLQYDICVFNLSSNNMNDERLLDTMSCAPPRSLILIEDIDCIFQQRKKADDKESITFSGLLNAIDGVVSSEGRVLFMTTNHISTLDPALIRPGRVDVSIELKNAGRKQMHDLFLRFFPDKLDLAGVFSQRGTDREWSMATLQGHLLKYRENPDAALTKPISVV